MKNLFFALLLSIPAVAVAQHGEYTLNAKVGELNAPAKAYLIYTLNGKQITDTAVITKGAFSFKGMVTEPVKARVIVDHTGSGLSNRSNSADNVIVYLEPTKITMSSKDSVKNVLFSGSVINTDCAAFLKSIAVPVTEVKKVNAEYASATSIERQDAEFKNAMRTRFNKANSMIKATQVDFIKAHPNSYFSLIALTEYAQNNQDINTIGSLFEGLSAKVRETTAGQKMLKVIVASRATAVN